MNQPKHYERGQQASYAWSARLEMSPRISRDETLARLGEFVMGQADPLKPLSGLIVGEGAVLRGSIILGLDPSKTYGTPSIETCEQLVTDLATEFSWQRKSDVWLHDSRVLMGLRPGYDSRAEVYELPVVHRLLAAQNIGKYSMIPGDVFSVRYIENEDSPRAYSEPGVAIYTPPESSDGLLHVAYALGQERVVAEAFETSTQVYQRI